MNVLHANAPAGLPLDGARYQPGVCNIGPAEIRARRLSGHVGLAATIGVVAALILFGDDPAWRLLAFIPAAGGAGGYLQAAMRFCANFGWRGVFNFTDRIHDTTEVTLGRSVFTSQVSSSRMRRQP